EIAVEGLRLREGEWVVERGETRLRKALGDECEHRRRLGQDTALRHHGGHPPLGVNCKIFVAALFLGRQADPHGVVFRPRLLEGDMGGERAGVGRIVELDHRAAFMWENPGMPLIAVTRLRIRSFRFVPAFGWWTWRALVQARHSPGNLRAA